MDTKIVEGGIYTFFWKPRGSKEKVVRQGTVVKVRTHFVTLKGNRRVVSVEKKDMIRRFK